jgi:riboflavin kinase / FMN adenylyltransferase
MDWKDRYTASGRWVEGVVVHGDKRGRLLGFPTANIVLDASADVSFGVYAVRVHVNGRVENGVACYGTRPQFDDGSPRLEVHILDFDEDIYGEHLVVELVAFQRGETTFVNVQALVDQMSCDCDDARHVLGHRYRDEKSEVREQASMTTA